MMLFRRPLKVVAATFLGLALIYAGCAVFAARLTVYPWWYKRQFVGVSLPECSSYQTRVYQFCDDPKKSLSLDFESFQAERPEGKVTGWSIAPEGPAVATAILVHGGGADRRAMLKHVRYLRAAGLHVLDIDCHNHGLSPNDGRGLSFGLHEAASVLAAADWAQAHVKDARSGAPLPVVALGTSQGAFAALYAAAQSPQLKAVVAENPYISVKRLVREFPAIEWLPKNIKEGAFLLISAWIDKPLDELDVRHFGDALSKTPVLLIHGRDDHVTSAHQSQEIFDLLKGKKELWLVDGADHEYVWNVAGREYERRVLKFLSGALGLKTVEPGVRPPASASAGPGR